ncbi:MAG: hypothetical protein WA290_14360, partial [Mycobacterium sp.]
MNKFASCAIATAMIAAGFGLGGLGGVTEAHAQPIPNWCPGDLWDPSWGSNWDWNDCHGSSVAAPTNNGPTYIQPPPRVGPSGPGPGGPGSPAGPGGSGPGGAGEPGGPGDPGGP